MIDWLTTAALAPLLIGQGLYTRVKTPKLPEAVGSRRGQSGDGPCLRVMVLGDSAAAGVGVRFQSEALSGQLASELGRDFSVTWSLVAATGLDSSELLHTLETTPVERFDAVLISVGVNDVTSRIGEQDWRDNLGRLVDRLKSHFGVRLILFSPVPPMHAFPALPQPLRWWLGSRARLVNLALREEMLNNPGCQVLPGDFPLDPRIMASDGFHPGESIYTLWAQDAAAIIRSRFLKTRKAAHPKNSGDSATTP